MSESHPLTDSTIAEYWPDMDTPQGRDDIRRQFDALMAQIKNSSWKPFPRFPEHMAAVVVEKSRTMADRLNGLKAIIAGIPPHLLKYQWVADPKPSFGEKYVRIIGDDGMGFGRQYIATIPSSKGYFGTLAEFIAAANPDTVSMMVARIEDLEAQLEAAKKGGAS